MTRPSSVVVAAAVLAAAAAGPAGAARAPKQACNLISDAQGDGRVASGAQKAKAADALDIVSGDVATGLKTVVAVLRLKSLDIAKDPETSLGTYWAMGFEVGGEKVTFTAFRGHDGAYAAAATVGSVSAELVSFKADGAAKTLTWTLSRSAVVPLKAKHQTLKVLHSRSAIRPLDQRDVGADAGDSPATYRDRAPSCVKAA